MTTPAMPNPGGFEWQPNRQELRALAAWLRGGRESRRDALRAGMAEEGRPDRSRGHGRGRGRSRVGDTERGVPVGGFDPAGFGVAGFPGVGFPFTGRPPHERRGARRGRGDVRTAILALVAEQPMHGYQIIQEITDRSVGMWKPSPGSVYPALQLLEDQGLIRFEIDEGRRVVHLTEQGRRHVDENRAELEKVWQPFAGSHTEAALDMRSAMTQVGMAAMQVVRAGTAAQIARARKILAAATRDIYAVLAEEDVAKRPDDEPPT